MSKTEFLYLSEPDLIQSGVLDAGRCVDVCEEVFRLLHDGDYLMGGANHNEHGLVLVFPKESAFEHMPVAGPERRFIAMPAYLRGRFSVCGEKWYGSNVVNPKARGLPRSVLTVTLNDPETCEPLAMMSGNLISAMRTGCIPGVGVRYLANKDAKTISVIGGGPVQKATLLAMKAGLKGLEKVAVMTVHPDSARQFAAWVEKELGLEGQTVETLEEVVALGDIVSVAASPKEPLFFQDRWFKPGATVLLTSPMTADEDFWCNHELVFDNTRMHQAYYEEAAALGDVKKACNGWGLMYALMDQGKLPALDQCVSLGDVSANLEKMEAICFPELATTGYSPVLIGEKYFDISEPIPGPSTDFLCAVAKATGLYIVTGISEKSAVPGKLYNSQVSISPEGEIVSVYRKIHVWGLEKLYWKESTTCEFATFEMPMCTAGTMICYDTSFPETARVLALMGSNVIFDSTAWRIQEAYQLIAERANF